MGQENLKKAIGVVDTLIEQAEKSFADGVQISDLGNFIAPVLAAGTIDWKAAFAEAKDRTPESNQELIDFIKTDLKLTDEVAQNKVQSIIAAIANIDNVILAFQGKAIVAPPVVAPVAKLGIPSGPLGSVPAE